VSTKIVHKAYKFRIYPNQKQEVDINKTFGCVRFYWNNLVAAFNSYDHENNPTPTFYTPKELKEQYPWLKEVSAVALQQKQRDFLQFRRQYFAKKQNVGVPLFKKKSEAQAYRLTNQRFEICKDKLKLEKIGLVSAVFDRDINQNCNLLSITISKNKVGQYFASICVEEPIKQKPKTNKHVGIDLGIKTLATLSNGAVIQNPHFLRDSQSKLKRAQRHLSHKQKGSVRRKKCINRVAVLHNSVANKRNDFLHSITTGLINDFDTIYLEDLNVNGMLQNHKLAQAISDVSWAKFGQMLVYKADWYGKRVSFIDRFAPSSKECHCCGWKNDTLTLKDRIFKCPSCGMIIDRDLNAAKNIKAFGVASAIRTQSGESMNRDEAFTTPISG
jgi:putative transposase